MPLVKLKDRAVIKIRRCGSSLPPARCIGKSLWNAHVRLTLDSGPKAHHWGGPSRAITGPEQVEQH
jgi:hypothetical protein